MLPGAHAGTRVTDAAAKVAHAAAATAPSAVQLFVGWSTKVSTTVPTVSRQRARSIDKNGAELWSNLRHVQLATVGLAAQLGSECSIKNGCSARTAFPWKRAVVGPEYESSMPTVSTC